MQYLICIAIGYLLGCINPAYIIGKMHGVDIREYNTGNAGASNVTTAFGWKEGVITAVIDILKSFAAAMICASLYPNMEAAPFIGGACAILGHIFPFYLGFRGGKGYASYMGMAFAVNWKFALILVVLGVVITLVTDYIALATMSTTVVTPVYYLFKHQSYLVIGILLLLMAVIFYKHRINIVRIIHKEEIGLRNVNKHRIN